MAWARLPAAVASPPSRSRNWRMLNKSAPSAHSASGYGYGDYAYYQYGGKDQAKLTRR